MTRNDPLRAVLRLLQIALAGLVIFFIWPYVAGVVWLLIISFFFTTILLPTVNWLEGQFRYRILAVLATITIFLMIIFIFVFSFTRQLGSEASSVTRNLKKEQVENTFRQFSEIIVARLPDYLQEKVRERITHQDFSGRIGAYVGTLFEQITGVATRIGSVVFNIVLVLIFTILILLDYHEIKKGIMSLFPNRYFEIGLNLVSQVEKQVSSYLQGQLMAAGGVALLSIIGLWLLNLLFHANLTLIIFIGILAGLSNLIPLIGPFVGMIPAIIIAILNNIQSPVAIDHYFYIPHIIIMFIIVQQIDNNLISPLVVGSKVGMHPLVIIAALLIGSNLMGPLGMLVAVPAAGVIKVIIKELIWVLKNTHLLVES